LGEGEAEGEGMGGHDGRDSGGSGEHTIKLGDLGACKASKSVLGGHCDSI
jgi:WD40 repeat protein